MNTIVFTQFVTPVQGASRLEIALARFGAWSDAEIAFLEDLFDIADFKGPIDGYEDAINDVVALGVLRLAANATQDNIGRLLAEALPVLERLLEFIRTIPLNGAFAGGGRSDFDMWVDRSESRLKGVLATLRRALAA